MSGARKPLGSVTGHANYPGGSRSTLLALGVVFFIFVVACSNVQAGSDPPTARLLPTPMVTILGATPTSRATGVSPNPSLTPLPDPTPTRTPTPTPGPYDHLMIDSLASRTYGNGQLTVYQTLGNYEAFTRYLVSYPSDGLEIYGFLNIPHGSGPYPVVIAIHGYIDPAVYQTLDYTTRYADALARAGFLVLHPNLRGYSPSSNGENIFRVGMATDVLNLAAIVRQTAGREGPLLMADSERIGLWGHSMGGGISLRVITIDPEIDAAVLYGSMSGDEIQNFEKILEWSEGTRGLEELAFPPDLLTKISPIYFLDRIKAAVSIHHGEADTLVPPEWSDNLCQDLSGLGIVVSCYTYPGQPHTFFGEGDQLFVDRTIQFLNERLVN